MLGLLVRLAVFLFAGSIFAASGLSRLGPDFYPLFLVMTVVNAIGFEAVWTVAAGLKAGVADRVIGLYGAVLLAAVVVSIAGSVVEAAPYAPYCEGIFKYINWASC